jgi:phage terminase large subunit
MQSKKVYFCGNELDYERKNYVYKADKDGKLLDEPLDKDNHLLDATGYICNFLRYLLGLQY